MTQFSTLATTCVCYNNILLNYTIKYQLKCKFTSINLSNYYKLIKTNVVIRNIKYVKID